MKLAYILMFLLISTQLGFSQKLRSQKPEDRPLIWFNAAFSADIDQQTMLAEKTELTGTVDVEELLRKRSKLIGKLVKLRFYRADFVSRGQHALLIASSHNYQLQVLLYLPDNEEAVDWAIDKDKSDASDEVYIFVGQMSLYGIGSRRRKLNEGYKYVW